MRGKEEEQRGGGSAGETVVMGRDLLHSERNNSQGHQQIRRKTYPTRKIHNFDFFLFMLARITTSKNFRVGWAYTLKRLPDEF